MFGGRFSSSVGVLGIDIGVRSIKMLQLQEHGSTTDTLNVVGAGEEQIPIALHAEDADIEEASEDDPTVAPASIAANSALAERLRHAFTSGRFTGRRCVVGLPRSDVRVQSVRLPKMPEAELHQAVLWEASQRFGMPTEAMEVDFIRTGATLQSGENREEVIIVAASHEHIRARLEPILSAGFRPVAIDTDFAALARTFSRQFRRETDRQNVRAIVEIGSTGSTVLILRGDQIAFCKSLDISGRQFNECVAEHLDMDLQAAAELRMARIHAMTRDQSSAGDEQHSSGTVNGTDPATERAVYEAVRPIINELIKEINLCLRYFGVTFRGKPPSQIIVTGGDGLEPRLAEAISHGCKVAVAHDDQIGTLSGLTEGIHRICRPGLAAGSLRGSASMGCWAVAAGLSLRGMAESGQSIVGRLLSAMSFGKSADTSSVKEAA